MLSEGGAGRVGVQSDGSIGPVTRYVPVQAVAPVSYWLAVARFRDVVPLLLAPAVIVGTFCGQSVARASLAGARGVTARRARALRRVRL